MNKVAVFGNAGGGKSTLARRLAEISGLPLHVLDIVQFRDGRYWPGEKDGGKASPEQYLKLHADILAQDRWIIDGYGSVASAWERFAAADTLIHVDLPIHAHYWGVTRRLVAGMFRNPPGWPENSPVWESSLDGYRVVGLCHRHLTPKYREMVAEAAASKRVHHLRSRAAMRAFLNDVANEATKPSSAAAPGGNTGAQASSPP
jgi:adenylate kinase family enzyme